MEQQISLLFKLLMLKSRSEQLLMKKLVYIIGCTPGVNHRFTACFLKVGKAIAFT
jgi:hypothetical protein